MQPASIMEAQIAAGLIQGATAILGTGRQNEIELGFGSAGHGDVPMTVDTIVDIASLTKVLAVTTALLICRDRGLIDFDAPFTRYLPEFRLELPQMPTVRQLAAHCSGFSNDKPYFSENGRDILNHILQMPPVRLPDTEVEYSCLNFLLLGRIVERITGESLTAFCQREIFTPLAMADTSLGIPVTTDPARLAQTLASDGPGQISDAPANRVYRDGGCAGNAGAFSTARDLAKFCRCLLNEGVYGNGRRLLAPAASREITTACTPGTAVQRSFGWVLKDDTCPAAFASHRTIYHTGWSGQTIFVDFTAAFFAVVLTVRCGDHDLARRGRFALIEAMHQEFRPES